MRHAPLITATVAALLPFQSAMAQEVSTEVGPATVWFALLVIVFAVLVAVGLFMAQESPEEQSEPRPFVRPAAKAGMHSRRHQARRKQEEFS